MRGPLRETLKEVDDGTRRFLEARQALSERLKRRQLVFYGRCRGERDFIAIDPTHWIDYNIDFSRDGILTDIRPTSTNPFHSRYEDIRAERDEILKRWPEKESIPVGISKAVSDACRYFCSMMRASPDFPTMTKGEAIKIAKARFPGLSERGAIGAWDKAVQDAGAAAWSKPGRRPKKNQGTENETPD